MSGARHLLVDGRDRGIHGNLGAAVYDEGSSCNPDRILLSSSIARRCHFRNRFESKVGCNTILNILSTVTYWDRPTLEMADAPSSGVLYLV
jgi:hypothetical protein